jgi:hypothetical protein
VSFVPFTIPSSPSLSFPPSLPQPNEITAFRTPHR